MAETKWTSSIFISKNMPFFKIENYCWYNLFIFAFSSNLRFDLLLNYMLFGQKNFFRCCVSSPSKLLTGTLEAISQFQTVWPDG